MPLVVEAAVTSSVSVLTLPVLVMPLVVEAAVTSSVSVLTLPVLVMPLVVEAAVTSSVSVLTFPVLVMPLVVEAAVTSSVSVLTFPVLVMPLVVEAAVTSSVSVLTFPVFVMPLVVDAPVTSRDVVLTLPVLVMPLVVEAPVTSSVPVCTLPELVMDAELTVVMLPTDASTVPLATISPPLIVVVPDGVVETMLGPSMAVLPSLVVAVMVPSDTPEITPTPVASQPSGTLATHCEFRLPSTPVQTASSGARPPILTCARAACMGRIIETAQTATNSARQYLTLLRRVFTRGIMLAPSRTHATRQSIVRARDPLNCFVLWIVRSKAPVVLEVDVPGIEE